MRFVRCRFTLYAVLQTWYASSTVLCSYFSHRVAIYFHCRFPQRLCLFQTPFLLEGIQLQRPPPFRLLPIFSTSTYFSIYAVNPLPDNHGGQTTHLHRPLGTDSHAKPHRQQPQARLQSKYVDLTTNSERLPPRPRERSTLEKTYARWCCGSILGVIAWIVVVFLLITVPVVVVALRNLVSLAYGNSLEKVLRRKENQLAIQMQTVADMDW